MDGLPLPLPAMTRVAFAASAAWVVLVAWLGQSEAIWWGWPIRIITSVPVVVACILTAIRPRMGRARWAAGLLMSWALIQTLRIQWSNYPWRLLLVASSTYGVFALVALALGAHVATESGLMCAGRRAASDDRRKL